MFIENKYYRWYYNIINKAKSRVLDKYTERHHIVPKSLGGNDHKDNLVRLTGREHFICHLLLVKMTTDSNRRKMVYAAWRMSISGRRDQERYLPSSHAYEYIRTQRAIEIKSIRGEKHPRYGKKTGRTADTFTDKWKDNISKAKLGNIPWNKGIPRTQEVKDAVSEANTGKIPWNKGKEHPEDTKQKIKNALADKKWIHDGEGTIRFADPDIYTELLAVGWMPGQGPRKSKR